MKRQKRHIRDTVDVPNNNCTILHKCNKFCLGVASEHKCVNRTVVVGVLLAYANNNRKARGVITLTSPGLSTFRQASVYSSNQILAIEKGNSVTNGVLLNHVFKQPDPGY